MPGLKPRKYKDHRRYSFARTFGTTGIFSEIDLDTGLANFNQNIPNPVTGDPALVNGCTAFARTDIATNEDKIVYKPGFTYKKSCVLAGVLEGAALPLETAFKSGVVDGLQAVGETTDAQALTHARGSYFEVHPANGQDMFDSLWSALKIGQRGISVGTPWFPELTNGSELLAINIRSTDDWHDWESIGVKRINGVPYMKVKAWTGDIKWLSRQVVNALYSVQGSDALTDVHGKATIADIQTVRLTKIQLLISLLQRLLAWTTKLQGNNKFMDPDSYMYPWDTPQHNYHNVRVICDNVELTLDQKNILCECIYQESGFHNYEPDGTPVQFHNKDKNGQTWSTDFGICQVNDYFNTGTGKPFPNVDYVMHNPDKVVAWMANILKTTGRLQPWSSYTSGAYKKWGLPGSPMWALHTDK